MRIVIIISLLVILGCSDIKKPYSIKEGVRDNKVALQLTSDKFWVDRVEVGDLIERHGGDVFGCDWRAVEFTVTNKVVFLKTFEPALIKLAKEL